MSTGSNVATAEKTQKVGVRTLVQIGMLAAIAVVLMLFEIPLPFAPSFYKIDFSEVLTSEGPVFVHIKVEPGNADVPVIPMEPEEIRDRFIKTIKG